MTTVNNVTCICMASTHLGNLCRWISVPDIHCQNSIHEVKKQLHDVIHAYMPWVYTNRFWEGFQKFINRETPWEWIVDNWICINLKYRAKRESDDNKFNVGKLTRAEWRATPKPLNSPFGPMNIVLLWIQKIVPFKIESIQFRNLIITCRFHLFA